MPIKLNHLVNKRRQLEIEYMDEKGQIVYNPGAVTEKMLQEIDDTDENSINLMLARVGISWDVVYDDGKPIPFADAEGHPHKDLALVPIPFKAHVLTSIMEDARGKAPKAADS